MQTRRRMVNLQTVTKTDLELHRLPDSLQSTVSYTDPGSDHLSTDWAGDGKWQNHMKADVITPGNCKLVLGSLVTISINLADGRIVKTTAVQRDYIITKRRRPFYQPDGRHGCVSTSVMAVISNCLLYPALSVMLGPINWSVINESLYYWSSF